MGVFWTDAEFASAMNETLRVWQALVGEWNLPYQLPITSLTTYVDVPKQIVSIQRVSFNGAGIGLISIPELDYGFPGWESVTGTPEFWAPVGVNIMALYPSPSSGQLLIEGIQETPQLDSDGSFLNIGEEELTKFLDYAQHYLAFKEGSPELDSTMDHYKRLIEAALYRNARLKVASQFYRAQGLIREEAERPPVADAPTLGVR